MPFSKARLYLGDGGVDDGEDADVVIHELIHHLAYDASPEADEGYELSAIEEGIADYCACSYSRRLNPFNWEVLFNWDFGTSSFLPRFCTSTNKYSDGLSGEVHEDGELIAAAGMRLWERIGDEAADKLILSSLHLLRDDQTMPEWISDLLLLDKLTFADQYKLDIEAVAAIYDLPVDVVDRPLIQPPTRVIDNKKLVLPSGRSYNYILTTASGQLIEVGQATYTYQLPDSLEAGMYILVVEGSPYKLLKLSDL